MVIAIFTDLVRPPVAAGAPIRTARVAVAHPDVRQAPGLDGEPRCGVDRASRTGLAQGGTSRLKLLAIPTALPGAPRALDAGLTRA